MNIIQITPKVPPVVDGIGDYAYELAQGLQHYGIITHFITLKEQLHSEKINNFPILEIPTQTAASFVDTLPQNINTIILHYSDFPYDKKFASPLWLLKGLIAAKQRQNIQLLIMFHEFPFTPTLNKKLYLFPSQSFVAWRLAEIADVVFTNNSVFKNILEKKLQQPVESIPVFSNIGEPENVPLLTKRTRRIIIFGTPARRARIYQKSLSLLTNTCRSLQIKEIYDIGDSFKLNISEIGSIPIIQTGRKPAQDISQIMLNSLAGIAYSNDNKKLAKSGVFASYCAHGLVPIITRNESALEDGIQVNQNFLFLDSKHNSISINKLQKIANNAHQWYDNHNKAKTIEAFASKLLATRNFDQVALV